MKLETLKMKDLLNKAASGAAFAALFLVGCVIAGLGLSVAMVLAMFALSAIGLAILASPLVALIGQGKDEELKNAEAA
jgi:hypothetical protein